MCLIQIAWYFWDVCVVHCFCYLLGGDKYLSLSKIVFNIKS